jgi:phospholipid/cholesterol/gamma-HCH transport system substrate-binding protein
MSGAYVDIKMGKSKDLIEVGGDIATQTNPDMMASLSDNVLPAVGEILPKVDSLLANLNKLVGDPALLKSVQSLEGITDNINKASLSLNTVIGRQVPGMMNNVNHVATNLDSITRDLIVLSAELKRLPISSTMDNVNEMTGNLAKFSNQLNSRESTLGLLMNDPELYNRINRLSADVDSLIVDLQKNPKRYISIKLL